MKLAKSAWMAESDTTPVGIVAVTTCTCGRCKWTTSQFVCLSSPRYARHKLEEPLQDYTRLFSHPQMSRQTECLGRKTSWYLMSVIPQQYPTTNQLTRPMFANNIMLGAHEQDNGTETHDLKSTNLIMRGFKLQGITLSITRNPLFFHGSRINTGHCRTQIRLRALPELGNRADGAMLELGGLSRGTERVTYTAPSFHQLD